MDRFRREETSPALRNPQSVTLVLTSDSRFPGLESRLLFSEELTPVCAPSVLETNRTWIAGCELTPTELKNYTLLHSDTCTINWGAWLEGVGAEDVLLNASNAYFDSCMLSYAAAIEGLGFAVANLRYMAPSIAAGTLIAPFHSILQSGYGWYLVYPKRNEKLARVTEFESWISGQAMQSTEILDRSLDGNVHLSIGV